MRLLQPLLLLIVLMLASLSSHAQQYQYDNAGRLTAALYANGASIRYEYDAASNITRVRYIAAPTPLPPDGVIDTPDMDVTIDAGQAVNFTGTGTDPDNAVPLTFLWDFDGAAPDSNDEDPGDVIFATAGTYTVTFTVSDATNLTDPTPDTVVVTVNPVAPDGVIDTPTGNVSIQAGQSVNFSGTGTDPDGATPLTYLWNFGSATNSTDEDPGAVTFSTAGTYTVTFTVTDADGLADPTPDSLVVTVTAAPTGGTGGSGNSGGGSGGGGSVFLLPLLCALLLLARKLRPALLALLVVFGTANAQTWFNEASGTDQNLNDVWMASTTLAYAVGNAGTVLQYDGSSWTAVDVGTTVQLNGVWGTGPGDVWIVGASGTVLHFDGTSWTPVDIGENSLPLNDVWTAGPGSTVYIAGARGVWFNDGSGWAKQGIQVSNTNVTLDPNQNFTAIRGTDNYIVLTSNGAGGTDEGLFVNFDWVGLSTFVLEDVWAYDDTFMLAVGAGTRLMDGGDPTNGSTANWQNYAVGLPARGVWGANPQKIWAVGGDTTYGRITHYDGNAAGTWSVEVTTSYRPFNGVDGVDAGNVIAVGNLGTIYRLFTPDATPTAANFPNSGLAEGNVNTFTGELVYEVTDFSIGSDPLEFRRYYTSTLWDQGTVGERLADNWTHNYEWRLDSNYEGDSSRVRITDYRGREYVFDIGATSNTLISPTWANVSLTVNGGLYVMADLEAEKLYALDGNGLVWIEDRNGNRHTLIYNQGFLASVNNGKENQIAFEYTPGGRMARAYVPEGGEELEVAFTYSGALLTEATASSGYKETYAYDTNALITSVSVGGTIAATWSYGSDGRVSSTSLTEGGTFTYSYSNNSLVVSQPSTTQRTYTHTDMGQLVRYVDGEGAMYDYGYDADGRRVSITDPVGRFTQWSYDAVNRMLESITEPGGFTTTYEYVAGSSDNGVLFWNLSKITDPDLREQIYTRDSNGNIQFFTDQENEIWEFTYDANGRLLESLSPLGGRTIYTRTVDGSVQTATDPRGNTTEYRYDLFQRMERIIYPDTSEASFTYTTRFEPDQSVSRSGATVDYTYDFGDRITRVDYSDGSYEVYAHDTAGAIISYELPGGLITSYRYDARRNIDRVTYPGNITENLIYDSSDRLIRRLDANDEVWSYEYWPDNSLKATIDPDGERVEYRFDGDPRRLLTSVTRGVETHSMIYDNLGHLSNVTDPLERVLQGQRDARGFLTGTTLLPDGINRLYDRNALGQVVKYTNPLGGTVVNDYGDDGRLDRRTNPLNEVTTIDRDSLNRVTLVTHPNGGTTSMSYARSGVIGNITGSDSTVVDFQTTPEGRLVGGTNLELGYSPIDYRLENSNGIRIQYNNDDRPWRITVAEGKVIEYEYNWRGDVIAVRDWLGGETTITPTRYGKRDDITYANGLYVDYAYDDRRRISGIQFGLAGSATGPIGSITLNRSPSTGRVDSAVRNLPGPQNIPDLNRVFSFNIASRVNGFSYDSRGNLVDDGKNSYEYDTLNRLTSFTTPLSTTRIAYDALGKVVQRVKDNETRQFLSNYALRKPRITVERDGAGNDLWYYVHTLDGKLLYRINGDGIRHFYHFDENGNTVFLTDNNANVIQTYFYSPMGELLAESGGVGNDNKKGAESADNQQDENVSISDDGKASNDETGHNNQEETKPNGESVTRTVADDALKAWLKSLNESSADTAINGTSYLAGELEKVLAPMRDRPTWARFGLTPAEHRFAGMKYGEGFKSMASSYLGIFFAGIGSGFAADKEYDNPIYKTEAGRITGAVGVALQNLLGLATGGTQFYLGAADVAAMGIVGDKLGLNDLLFANLARTTASLVDAAAGGGWESIWRRATYSKVNEGLVPKKVAYVGELIGAGWYNFYHTLRRIKSGFEEDQEALADFYHTP